MGGGEEIPTIAGCPVEKDVSYLVLAFFDITPLVNLREISWRRQSAYDASGCAACLLGLLLEVMHAIPAGRILATIVLA